MFFLFLAFNLLVYRLSCIFFTLIAFKNAISPLWNEPHVHSCYRAARHAIYSFRDATVTHRLSRSKEDGDLAKRDLSGNPHQ